MKITIRGYIVERLHPDVVRIEGKGAVSDMEAREILGIGTAKRQWEMLEEQFKKLG